MPCSEPYLMSAIGGAGLGASGGASVPLVFLLLVAGVLIAGIMFLPLAVAFPAAFLKSRYLRRWERGAVLALTLIYLGTVGRGSFGAYFGWLFRFIPLGALGRAFGIDQRATLLSAPWASVIAIGLLISSFITWLVSHNILNWHLGKRLKAGHTEEIMPSAEEKKKAGERIARSPGEMMLPALLGGAAGSRSIPIGYDREGNPATITEQEIATHGLIFGSTGSGKTETIKVIAGGLMDLGWSGMILDLKEDAQKGGLMDWCADYGSAHGVGFQKFRLSDPDPDKWFNVLKGMGPDEARDTIIASQQFDDGYYRALNERQLGQMINLLYAANSIDPIKYSTPTVYGIGKILAAPDVPALMRETVATVLSSAPGFTRDDFDMLVRPDQATAQASSGLGARLTAMYETQAGRVALRGTDEKPSFDVTQAGLSYVGLDSMGKPELTRLVSASVLRRMAVYAADRTSGKLSHGEPRFLIVDEANFVNRRLLLELLSRARSAGIACLVCTQGPTDWQAREPGEPDLTSLAQNTNVSIIMSQGERTNAELCADIIGRGEKTRFSERVQVRNSPLQFTTLGEDEGGAVGTATAITEEDFLVSPDKLRSLSIGEAIIRVGKPVERRMWIHVVPREASALAIPRSAHKRAWSGIFTQDD